MNAVIAKWLILIFYFPSPDNKIAKYFPDVSMKWRLHEVLVLDGENLAFVLSMPFLLFLNTRYHIVDLLLAFYVPLPCFVIIFSFLPDILEERLV